MPKYVRFLRVLSINQRNCSTRSTSLLVKRPRPMALESRSLYSGHFTPTALSSQSSLDGGGPHYPEDLVDNSTMSAMAPSGSSSGLLNEREVVRRAGREAISQFLDGHTCFSVLRASGKVVVFDTRIPIQLAFYALVEHGKFKRVGFTAGTTVCGSYPNLD